ncbi:MAG: IPT/TIG domain-containing protein [Desulfobacterales bacterium]
MDPKWLGLICGLVGLFSDTAIRKLGEMFNVILGTKEDKRGDKLPDEEAKGPTKVVTGKGPPPVIRELNPNSVQKKETPMLTITGANFRENATVRVKSNARTPEEVTSTSIRVQLTEDDTAGGDAEIIVINEDLTESNVKMLKVQ